MFSPFDFHDSPDEDFESLWSKDFALIPPDLRDMLSPATHYLYEWTDYWLEFPGADLLRLGDTWIQPVKRDLFQVRFENQIGLSVIQPFRGTQPLSPPLRVEVLSRKFPDPAAHLSFFRTLLDDLFARAARLPFTFSGVTQRGVSESLRPPTPLFMLHFLCQYAPALGTAISIVQAAPHRRLRDCPTFVPIAEATDVDADVLIRIVQTPDEWVSAQGFPLAERLHRHAPRRVWQRRSEETFDTPENRFVLAFLRQILFAAERLSSQRWWRNVSAQRQRLILDAIGLLQQTILHPMFADVGDMHYFPSASQVLLRREGYREMLELWQVFHHARRPLFAPLERAIEVRDIATLYEIWAFFALVEEIAVQFGESPALELRLSDERGFNQMAEARFGGVGKLIYNRSYSRSQSVFSSYSVPLRPDFTWVREGKPDVVLDAKFRLVWAEEGDSPIALAQQGDLHKMHTYRDALGVRAAVSVYPGDVSVFYDCKRGKCNEFMLRDLLTSDYSGIGAVVMRPASC